MRCRRIWIVVDGLGQQVAVPELSSFDALTVPAVGAAGDAEYDEDGFVAECE